MEEEQMQEVVKSIGDDGKESNDVVVSHCQLWTGVSDNSTDSLIVDPEVLIPEEDDSSDDSTDSLIVDNGVLIKEKDLYDRKTLKSIIIQMEKKKCFAPGMAKILIKYCQLQDPDSIAVCLRDMLLVLQSSATHKKKLARSRPAAMEVDSNFKHENESLKHNIRVLQKKFVAREKELKLKIKKLEEKMQRVSILPDSQMPEIQSEFQLDAESKYGSSSDDIPVASSLLVSSDEKKCDEIESATNDDNKMDVQLMASVSNDSEYSRTDSLDDPEILKGRIKYIIKILKAIIIELAFQQCIPMAEVRKLKPCFEIQRQDPLGYSVLLRDLLDVLKHTARPSFAAKKADFNLKHENEEKKECTSIAIEVCTGGRN